MDFDLLDVEHLDYIDKPSISQKILHSESDTLGTWSNSPKTLTSSGLESFLDEVLHKLHGVSFPKPEYRRVAPKPIQKKRGRKPIRPNDPIKKKTEEKDKYWLRMFRGYMKTRYSEISHLLSSDEQKFWLDHLSVKGVPDKGNLFSSYGKKYKNHLFSQPSFVCYFQEWFYQFGEIELSRKCERGSDLWFVFLDYASKDLVSYMPNRRLSKDSLDSPMSFSSALTVSGEVREIADFCMVSEEETIEELLD